MTNAIAVMDASIAYGASRWYRSVHHDPKWEYADKYRAEDDHRLYLELLHNILLYDKIVLDKSSVSTVAQELRELFVKINTYIGKELLLFDKLTEASSLEPVQRTVCSLIRGVLDEGVRDKGVMLGLSMPWAYSSPHHHDYNAFTNLIREEGLDDAFVPYAIYAYRGICYSGFANGLNSRTKSPAVYLASPGRIKVLSQLLDARDIATMKYPIVAYRDLVDQLKLPANGYVFSHLRSVSAAQMSQLTLAVAKQKPKDSLQFTLRLRASEECATIRKEWADRVWARSQSSLVGSEGVQTVSDATIHGSLTMIQLHGAAVD